MALYEPFKNVILPKYHLYKALLNDIAQLGLPAQGIHSKYLRQTPMFNGLAVVRPKFLLPGLLLAGARSSATALPSLPLPGSSGNTSIILLFRCACLKQGII